MNLFFMVCCSHLLCRYVKAVFARRLSVSTPRKQALSAAVRKSYTFVHCAETSPRRRPLRPRSPAC